MKSNGLRLHHKDVYEPLAQKTLNNILKRELLYQFGFENMGLIADSLINRFLEIMDQYSPEKIRLLPGQILWLAVAYKEKCGYGKAMLHTKLVPVRLTLVAPEDIKALSEGKTYNDIRPEVTARLLKEAKAQGGVLALTDIALLLNTTHSTITRAVKEYHRRHPGEVLPYRGTLHDMGPTCTHKIQTIELKLKGYLTQEIARRINHDPHSVDVYQNDFERVWHLYKDGKSVTDISFLAKLSRNLVEQYIRLIEEYISEDDKFSKNKRYDKRPKPGHYYSCFV